MIMKKGILIFTIMVVAIGCASKQQDRKLSAVNKTSDTLRIANDSLAYEILIIEPGFNSWVLTQPARGYYTENFLENRNRIYVTEYNQRVMQPARFDPNLYEMEINYEQNIHYGYEVNYLLYNYFLFFEQRYGQRFINSRSRRF